MLETFKKFVSFLLWLCIFSQNSLLDKLDQFFQSSFDFLFRPDEAYWLGQNIAPFSLIHCSNLPLRLIKQIKNKTIDTHYITVIIVKYNCAFLNLSTSTTQTNQSIERSKIKPSSSFIQLNGQNTVIQLNTD